jgi:signal transduction histidine kinase
MLKTLPAALPQRILLSAVPPMTILAGWGWASGHYQVTVAMLLLGSVFAFTPRLVSNRGTSFAGHAAACAWVAAVILPVAIWDAPMGVVLALAGLPFLASAWLSRVEAMQWSTAPMILIGLLAVKAYLKGNVDDAAIAALTVVVLVTSTGMAYAFRDALQVVSSDTDPRQRGLEREYEAVLEALETALGSSAKKDRFLSLMSFELRTPLTAIMGYSELLGEILEDIGPEHDVRETRAIEASSRRLLHVVDDILDLSQIGAGTLELRYAPVDLAAIVRLALDSTSADHPHVRLNAEIAQTGLIMGDYDRMGRVVSNLAAQAMKGAVRGETVRVLLTGRIRAVSLIVESAPDRAGPEDIKRIRDGLKQPVDEKPMHLGLELTVADSLLRSMQGELSVDRGPRGELRFIATLPIRQAFQSHSIAGDAA